MCDSVERVTVQCYDIAPPSLSDRLSSPLGPTSPRGSAAHGLTMGQLGHPSLQAVQRDVSSASDFTISTVQFTSTPVSFEARPSPPEMARETSVTFDIVRRTESLESRDNPFRPEGDLSKEVVPIVEAYKVKNPPLSPPTSPLATPLPPTPPVTPEPEECDVIPISESSVQLEMTPPTMTSPKSDSTQTNGKQVATPNGEEVKVGVAGGIGASNGGSPTETSSGKNEIEKKQGCCQKCVIM